MYINGMTFFQLTFTYTNRQQGGFSMKAIICWPPFLFWRWRYWNTGRVSNLPKITELINVKVKTWFLCLILNHYATLIFFESVNELMTWRWTQVTSLTWKFSEPTGRWWMSECAKENKITVLNKVLLVSYCCYNTLPQSYSSKQYNLS